MKTHIHKWKLLGYAKTGWGISTDAPVHWCSYCGSIQKSTLGHSRITKPKKKKS